MLPRYTLTDAALMALRDRILAGEWAAGAPLRQEALAAELGVSRIPLREALRRLEAEGLVTISAHRGAVVSPLPVDEAAELFELRALIEVDLARRAVPRLTAADDTALRHHAAAFERAVATGNVSAWGEANRAFHFALYAPAQRPRTLETVARLHAQSDRFLRLQLTLTRGTSRAVREHRAIAVAARARDTTRVVQLLREHILSAGRALADTLEHRRPLEKSS
ncbi:MAG: GntR family transcriptional regulator [Gemmatimonadales bacterium]